MSLLIGLQALAGMALALTLVRVLVRANQRVADTDRLVERMASASLILSVPAFGTTMILGTLGPAVAGIRVAAFAVLLAALLALLPQRRGGARSGVPQDIMVIAGATLAIRTLGLVR